MKVVILDASVMVTLYVQEQASNSAHEAMVRVVETRARLHAPDLLLVEVANALWKRVSRGELDKGDAMAAISDLSAVEGLNLHPLDQHIVPQALSLALLHGLTAYDATYAALATDLNGILVSGDRKLLAGARKLGLLAVNPTELLDHL